MGIWRSIQDLLSLHDAFTVTGTVVSMDSLSLVVTEQYARSVRWVLVLDCPPILGFLTSRRTQTTRTMGFSSNPPRFHFVSTVDDNLKCPLCHEVLEEPQS